MTRVEHLAPNVTLYLGDCREILPTLARPAALISDPPYGQSYETNYRSPPAPGARRNDRTVWPSRISGDGAELDPSHLLGASDIVLLWGAHRFGHRLPAGTTLVWDKVPNGKVRTQGDGEIAWLNVSPPRPLRIKRLLWDGVCIGKGARHEVIAGSKRVHPAQKPEMLMAWCIEQARVPAGGTICDPYMGAGSTGVAAVRAGHGFAGIELEPLYFDTACRRIADALSRPSFLADLMPAIAAGGAA